MIEATSKLISKKMLAASLHCEFGGVVNITLYENEESLQKTLNSILLESIVNDVLAPTLPQVTKPLSFD
jgi:hypothetical protein